MTPPRPGGTRPAERSSRPWGAGPSGGPGRRDPVRSFREVLEEASLGSDPILGEELRADLHASLDAPVQDEVVKPTLVLVSGWAVDGDRPALAVAVSVVGPGTAWTVLAYPRERPDVAEFFGIADTRCGYEAVLDLSKQRGRSFELYATIWGKAASQPKTLPAVRIEVADVEPEDVEREDVEPADVGREDVEPASSDGPGTDQDDVNRDDPEVDEIGAAGSGWVEVEVVDARLDESPGATSPRRSRWLLGRVEMPGGGEQLAARDLLTVRGWAVTRDGPVDEVEILVGGRSIGRARTGLHRPDIAEAFGITAGALSGFELVFDLEQLPSFKERLAVRVVVRSKGAEVVLDDVEVALEPARRLPGLGPSRRLQVLERRDAALVARSRLRDARRPGRVEELNLLVVTHDLGFGGGQLWLSELLEKSGAGRAFSTSVLSRAGGPLVEVLEGLGIEVRLTDEYTLRDAELYESQVLDICLWSSRLGHNAVLVNTLGAFVGADVALRLDLPLAWGVHESWPPLEYWKVNFPPGYVDPYVRATAMRVLASAPAVVFEADATRQLFLDATRPGAAVVVDYGVDVVAIEEYRARTSQADARAQLGIAERARVVLVLGTIEPRKAQTLITQAFEQIADRHEDAILVLVGETATPYCDALREYVATAGLAPRVRMVPVVSDTFIWYRAADLFVCGSDVESLPRSVLEVMAFGVPVVATAVFGLPELIEHGRTGLLYEARNLAAAVEALDEALSLPARELERLGAAGREVVLEHHDSRSYARQIPELLAYLGAHPGSVGEEGLEAIGGSARAAVARPQDGTL